MCGTEYFFTWNMGGFSPNLTQTVISFKNTVFTFSGFWSNGG